MLLSLVVGVFAARAAHAPVLIATGIILITSNRTLTADHGGQIRFGANNITLDCAGYNINYSSAYSGGCGGTGTLKCGIHSLNQTGITIKNCDVIGGYDYGMWISGTTTPSTVRNSSVSGASVGFRIEDASRLTFNNSAAVSNDAGFEIRDSTDVTLTSTDAVYSTGDGFDTNDSINVRIQFASAFVNGVNGIEFDDSPGSSVLNSEVLFSGKHGVSLDNSSGIRISANTIQGNTQDGLRLQNCDNGTIRNNLSDGNGPCNANQDNASTGNIWSGNTLQTWCDTVPNSH